MTVSRKIRLQLVFINRFPCFIGQSVRLLLLCGLFSGLAFTQQTGQVQFNRAMSAVHEADRLFDIGSQDSFRQAIKEYEKARAIFHALGNLKGEDLTSSSIAEAYNHLGDYQRAIDAYSLALKIRRELKDERGTAVTLTHIGAAYLELKELRKSVEYYTQALEIWRTTKDLRNEAITLAHLCSLYLYDELNAKQKAIESCTQSLPLSRKVNDTNNEAETQYLLGLTYAAIDEDEKSIEPYNEALSLYRKLKDRKGEADALHRLAMGYNHLGKPERALDYYNQALPIFREIKDLQGLAGALDNMALIYATSNNTQKALEAYDEALRVAREAKDHEGEGSVLHNMGLTYFKIGQNQKALEYYQKALALKQDFADRRLEAASLNGIGLVYRVLGDEQKARTHYLEALKISRALGDRTGQVNRLFNLARLDAIQNDFSAARERIEEAIAIIESLRSAISDQELRSSYFSTVQYYYDFYVEILMRLHERYPSKGHDAEALQVSERKRARALLDTLVEAGADIRQGVAAELLGRERSLQQRLNARAQAQMRILSGRHTVDQAMAVAQEIEALTTEFQQVETEIRHKSPNYAALTQPQPLTLKEIQTRVLDQDTLLLEYSLGEDRSYLWAVTPTSVSSYKLPKRDEIEAVARQVYALLSDKTSAVDALESLRSGKTSNPTQRKTNAPPAQSKDEPTQSPFAPEAAARLSQILLAPVAAQLGGKRLLIVADGALQYIPFGALPLPTARSATDKYQPLIVEHEIVTLPSASTLAVLRQEVKGRKAADKTVAVLADPVFEIDDERLSGLSRGNAAVPSGGPDKKRELPLGMERAATDSGLRSADSEIPRLPGTRDEARQILALVPAAEGKQALDFSASRQTATSGELSQYRYIHFATHGFLDSVHPELSGIVFSMIDEKGNPQDGFLRAHEVFNLKLPAELVVLSACQTGLGKEVRGEGLVGLTRGFMYAGAPRVVVSLWSVNDQATAELMARFYRGMLRDKLRPAAALRAAQVSLMKEKGWGSPFYWAAFTLQGEWR